MTANKATIGEVVADEQAIAPAITPRAESFEDVFRRESLGMVRLAYLTVGSAPLAEELVQDAFARLLERWDTVEQPAATCARAS